MQDGSAFPQGDAQFDGYSVHFSINVHGEEVCCAISLAALDSISGDRRRQKTHVLASFDTHRDRILRIAQTLYLRRPESVDGTIRVWENDVEDDGLGE
ncbi:hypothetical protein AcidC75_11920 [Acidisoma sp. C75]